LVILIVLAVVAVFVLVLLARTIRVIPQARAGVVERLGRYSRTLTPGLTIVIPFVDRVRPLLDLREQAVVQEMQTIDRRVHDLGVTEPTIPRQPQAEPILVQMPGVTDVAHAKDVLAQTAFLEFKLGEAGPGSKEDLLKQYNGTLPGEMEILPGSSGSGADAAATFYVVRKIAPVTGQDLR